MDIAAYLKELLNQNKYVFVPGLGSFLIRKNAVVHHQHKFSPPENSIDFADEEKNDDELINYISVQKNISQQASGYFIEKFVDQLKKEANAKNILVKEVLFSGEEQVHASFNQENFGLPPIQISTLQKEPPLVIKEIPDQTEPVSQKNDAENFYHEFSSNLPEEDIEPKKNTGFWVATVLLLAICCFGIYALYLYYPNVFKGLLPGNQPEVTVVRTPVTADLKRAPVITQSEIKNDTVTKAIADTLVAPAKTTAPLPQKVEKDTVKTADADMVAKSPYEIIGASFKTLKGAKTFLSQLQSKGMHHAKILNNTAGKQVLITFGSYQDKTAALNALEKIRTKDAHSEAYIQHYLK